MAQAQKQKYNDLINNVLGQYFCTYFGPLMNQYDGLKVARPPLIGRIRQSRAMGIPHDVSS